jgi:TIGR03009 family protein
MLVPLLLAILAVEHPQVAQLPEAPPPRLAIVEIHLAAWKEETAKLANLRTEISLTRTVAALKQVKRYSGVVLWLQPSSFILRLDNNGDPTGNDYEAFICDGKSVYAYNGLQKSILARSIAEEKPVRPVGPPTEEEMILEQWRQFFDQMVRSMHPGEHFAIKCLSGSETLFDRNRYQFKLVPVGGGFIALDIEPLRAQDKPEFTNARVTLIGPGNNRLAYMTAAVELTLPNGDTEVWKFTKWQRDIPGLGAQDFAFQKVPGFKLTDLRKSSKP